MDQEKAKKELLSESAVEAAVGGRITSGDQTRMVCQTPGCNYAITWDGYFLNQSFNCPHCSDDSRPLDQRFFNTLLGVEYIQ